MPQGKPSSPNIPSAIQRYGLAVASVALALLPALLLQHYKVHHVEVSLFLFAIALTAWHAGVGPAALSTVLSSLCFMYFFAPPIYSFAFTAADAPAIVILVFFAMLITRFGAVRRRIEGQLLQARDELLTDIDERAKTAEKLCRSEAYLAEAQRLTHTGSWAHDPATGESLYWSEEMFRLFGLDPQEGVPTAEIQRQRIHPQDYERLREYSEETKRQKAYYAADYRIVLPDGKVKYLETIGRPVFDKNGELLEYVGTAMDVTERKRAEEERERLRQLEADIAHINRVSVMGELAASLAHEIKQPMAAATTNVKTCLRWLQREPPDIGEAREALSRIVKDVNRAAAMIDRTRSLYKRDTPKREMVDLNELTREMIALLGDAANRHSISIRAELDGTVPAITADRVQMQQVLMNLMLNGIEAMKDTGGELTVNLKKTEDGQMLLSVSDLGVGLPVENADHIFDAFFTTKAQGTGMGLSICRRIIESHGGRLSATSNAGRGATFYFTLPANAGAQA